MNDSSLERRTHPRHHGVETHGIVQMRIRPGHGATLLDVSAGGALIESTYRLLPGTSVELQVDTADRRVCIRGRVLRCAVVRVWPTVIRYRGAVGFDGRLST
jgi:hypothetical protein